MGVDWSKIGNVNHDSGSTSTHRRHKLSAGFFVAQFLWTARLWLFGAACLAALMVCCRRFASAPGYTSSCFVVGSVSYHQRGRGNHPCVGVAAFSSGSVGTMVSKGMLHALTVMLVQGFMYGLILFASQQDTYMSGLLNAVTKSQQRVVSSSSVAFMFVCARSRVNSHRSRPLASSAVSSSLNAE